VPYMLLIMERPGQRAERTDAEGRAVYDRMLQYAGTLKARGVLRAAQSLKGTADAVRIERREGRSTLTDGPFAEAKEMVGGYFLVDCASRAEAVAIAEGIPAAEWATVEVREFGPCFE
jgi:hypothetical protein